MYLDFRDDWLTALGYRMQIPDLAFDEKGLLQLTLDQELIVTIHKPEESPYLTLFGQFPVEPITPEAMQKMLIENRNSARQLAPVFSIAENLDAIEVTYKLSQHELNGNEGVFEQLIEDLEYWRDYIKS